MTMRKHALMQRILEQLPPEERYSFSERQIEALHQSALSLPKARHIINIRWSIPFPPKGVYLVFFAGKEHRSRKRLLADGDFQLLPRVILVCTSLLGCAIVFCLSYSYQMFVTSDRSASNLDNSPDTIYPTVVPFKYDQEQCETSFREWIDGECVDYEHDHTF